MISNAKVYGAVARALKHENGARLVLELGAVVQGAYNLGVADGSRAMARQPIRKIQRKPPTKKGGITARELVACATQRGSTR